MVTTSKQILSEASRSVENLLAEVKSLLEGLDERTLNMPEDVNKWSILQCLKHMSFAIEVYNKNVEKAFQSGKHNTPSEKYKSHWKGDMFTRLISPKDNGEVTRPMRTFSAMNPVQVLNAESVITEFFTLHEKFAELIKQSSEFDINKVKVNTALGPLVKLRLGDAFRFVIGHAERHLVQIKRIKTVVNQVPA
ncbi:DinB family protein [Roseivirga sp.]|uniref:DinB family protein n=1 Tax=Roseivirga sp. TaxID=1964215 RepID=UPI003B8C29A7